MTHYLLLKFNANCTDKDFFSVATETFTQLQGKLNCVRLVNIHRNCITRSSNADLMVEMELTGEEALEVYLQHPLHQAFAQKIEPYLEQRITFDRV